MRKDKIIGKLPDVFIFQNGERVENKDDWEKRRCEIKKTAIELEFGGMPPEPDSFKVEKLTEPGKGRINCYRLHCIINGNDFTFCIDVYRPEKNDKCPVIVTGDSMYRNCSDEVINDAHRRGFAVVKFNRTELAHDMYNTDRSEGIYPLFPELEFSAISAWAWGYHRVVDALFTLDYIDTDNIAVAGHSRGGKTVLLAGALDERIRYVNPNGSGAHGCGCYRFEQYEKPGVYENDRSEKLEDLFSAVPYWMGKKMESYIGKETELPHDMHFIKALIAPRVLFETNAYGDIWANPRGSYITHLAAKEVWKLYGQENNCRTHYREGGHSHTREDYNVLFDLIEACMNNKSFKADENPYPDMEEIYELMKG